MSRAASSRWKPILAAACAAAVVAGLGAQITVLGPWYHSLREPAWKPPDVLFGPAWTLIFALAATAGVLGWRALRSRASRLAMCGFFFLNALFNELWSALFFRFQRPDWALLEVGLLWVSILLLMIVLYRASRAASWLMLPYLIWVSFAAALNLAVVRLNPPP
jgi:tryptophan-rich sensory protein